MKFSLTLLVLASVAFGRSTTGNPRSNPKSFSKTLIPSVEMENEEDTFYVVPIEIGVPPVTFNLAVDTGSTSTWVLSSKCPGCFSVQNSYNPSNSKNNTRLSQGNTYEDGSYVQGDTYADNITIAGMTARATFLSVNVTSVHWVGFSADGVLGLGYSPLSKGYLPLINALYAQHSIPNTLFSLYFSDNLFLGRQKATLTLGQPNFNDFANSTLKDYSVTVQNLYNSSQSTTGLWNFQSSNILLGNNTVAQQTIVHVDSSQQWIFVGIDDYPLVASLLVSLGFNKTGFTYQQPCKNSGIFPSMNIGYNYSQYLIIPSYRYVVMDGTSKNRTCYVTISPSNDNSWYIGDSLFRTYYSVFNLDNSSITFTPASWLPNIKYKHHSSSSSDDGLAGWAIALIVISCVIGVVAIAGIVWYVMKKRSRGYSNDSAGKPLQEVSLHG